MKTGNLFVYHFVRVSNVSLLLFTFFIANLASATNDLKSTIIGDWQSDSVTKDNTRIVMNVTFNKDGTCTTLLTYVNPEGQTQTYTFMEHWKISNNHIHYKVSKSSDEALIGEESTVEVIKFDKDKIIIKSGSDGHTSELVRLMHH